MPRSFPGFLVPSEVPHFTVSASTIAYPASRAGLASAISLSFAISLDALAHERTIREARALERAKVSRS